MRNFALMLSVAALPLAMPAMAATSVLTPGTLTATTYTQNFNALASSGESNALPTGFQLAETGSSTVTVDGNYTAGTGSDNAGDVYSFGSAALPADRALGTLFSGANSPLFGAVFTNGLTAAITSLRFNFAGEQWRSVAGAPVDRLDFQYRLGGGPIDTGSWIDLNGLDIVSLVNATTGAVDGNVNRALYAGTIGGLNIGVGDSFAFRFVDFDVVPGADAGLALDDLTITATTNAVAGVPEPATWAMMLLGFGSMGYVMRRRHSTRARIRFA